ncbi:2,3-diaminopropionate biosynthesis protein SbnA [Agrobacterium tumefaciens]|uniref:SbnA n=1 Tax=Agrobacterium tumefaciens TaxID=358 RepID=A0A1S6WDV4_AGRTU|nr:SbnA [Agrobacterium radiobacter]OMP71437.1 2,3-diaminopropionate biosynthesis protein SbnA [Agrobacterium tumefaciens]
MNVSHLFEIGSRDFFSIQGLIDAPVHIKCEALNVAGSIKIKPALEMIEAFEKSGLLRPGTALIESSSGNLGIALSMITAAKGYAFTCVTDPNATSESVAMMKSFGAEVIIVENKDAQGGYLGTRIALIRELCASNPSLIWVNQYANSSNWQAHYHTTGPEILNRFPLVDYLFIGVGTGGTFMGCARYFREHSPNTRVVAVDVEGSVTFGAAPGPRKIPGLGTSRKPEIIDERYATDLVYVSERETVQMCRRLVRHGLLAGGSTGTALSGILKSAASLKASDVVVTIMPDLGVKYLDTIYNDAWASRYGFIDTVENESALAHSH